jgi:DNA-binding NarL/FixJ family response regulator
MESPRPQYTAELLRRSNTAIADTLMISPRVVEKHITSIFAKLGLAPSDNDNRRVIAALKYVES